jgi:hypothetical protein
LRFAALFLLISSDLQCAPLRLQQETCHPKETDDNRACPWKGDDRGEEVIYRVEGRS